MKFFGTLNMNYLTTILVIAAVDYVPVVVVLLLLLMMMMAVMIPIPYKYNCTILKGKTRI
jgi:hypothetical protein